jgi:hypothetical protein
MGRSFDIRVGIRACAIAAAVCVTLTIGAASLAMGAPRGIFAKFAKCPVGAPNVRQCIYGEITGGTFAVGRTSVPINRTIVLQAGAERTNQLGLNEYFLVPATDGRAISANELVIPGGLQDMLGCSQEGCRTPGGRIVTNTVTASIELAASRTNPGILRMIAALFGEAPGLILPVQLQLHNRLLGSACYIGSEAHPIELRLTDGTTSPPPPNKPITGEFGTAREEEENGWALLAVTGMTLVDNAFSMPVARGCGEGLAPLVDVEIDRALGLESPGGHNTAILAAKLDLATREAVLASEAFP